MQDIPLPRLRWAYLEAQSSPLALAEVDGVTFTLRQIEDELRFRRYQQRQATA